MSEQVVSIDGVEVTFFKSKRAKSVNITIKPFTGVRVSVPSSISFAKAKKAVHQRMDWIKSHLSKMKRAEDEFTVFTPNTEFSTRKHTLELTKGKVDKLKVTITENKICGVFRGLEGLKSNESQLEIRKGIERAWKIEAKEYLPNRVAQLATKHGFQFKKVSIRNAKTRWGSCSQNNNINLSLHLMRLPDHLVDYVILHELVHTKIKNHSRDFWQLLDTVSGDAKGLDKEVKDCRIQIY